MNLARGKTDDIAYLICESQEVVVEEDGCDRQRIILVTAPRSKLQNR